MSDEKKSCATCDSFEPKCQPSAMWVPHADVGECRRDTVKGDGWPRVWKTDWCSQWVERR